MPSTRIVRFIPFTKVSSKKEEKKNTHHKLRVQAVYIYLPAFMVNYIRMKPIGPTYLTERVKKFDSILIRSVKKLILAFEFHKIRNFLLLLPKMK